MIPELRLSQLVVVGAVVLAGVGGTAVTLANRSADAQFLQDQRHPPRLQPGAVEQVVVSAPDPATGKGRGVDANCTSRGSGTLGNPWTCVVRYPSGKRVRLRVQITSDGFYEGRYAGGGGVATGCCLPLPGLER